VGEFYSIWLKLGNFVQQSLFQAKIEKKEAEYSHPRTKREKRYYTPLGEMILVRRAYETTDGIKVKVDEELGLPKVEEGRRQRAEGRRKQLNGDSDPNEKVSAV
jgi:hypothetical protein